MDREVVESSMIKSLGHDPSTMVLEVEFTKGQIYRYENVSPDVYEALLTAKSIGKAFSQLIGPSEYTYQRVL